MATTAERAGTIAHDVDTSRPPAASPGAGTHWEYLLPIAVVHGLACLALLPGLFSWSGAALAFAGLTVFGTLGINLGYHRLLTHRSLEVPKWLEHVFTTLTHLLGYRTYQTDEDSRNNWFVALVANGEGWHNNHHHDPASASNQHRWWEFDVTWWIILALERAGLATAVIRPRHVRREARAPRPRSPFVEPPATDWSRGTDLADFSRG